MESAGNATAGPSSSQTTLRTSSRINHKASESSLRRNEMVESRSKMQPAISDDEDAEGELEQAGSTRNDKGKATVPTRRWKDRFQVTFELENTGSVARDHLANERTYLAWCRTSLALASIGIAVTQLFRLANPTASPIPTVDATTIADQLLALSDSPTAEQIRFLFQTQFQQQDLFLVDRDPSRYRYLGKPIGGGFIALSLVFLMLGTYRFFKVQSVLMRSPSMFQPSRRSVAISTLSVTTLVCAAFAVILATR